MAAVPLAALALQAGTPSATGGRLLRIAAPSIRSVALRPLHGSGIRGTITYQASGRGTAVGVRLSGAPAKTRVAVLLHAGSCARQGASVAIVATGRATAGGTFASHGRVQFHGAPVGLGVVADGDHVFVVVTRGREAACARVPRSR